MVVLMPFRGLRYDPEVVGDPAAVLCPPYDLITPEIQAALRQASPYNVVHLEAGEGLDWKHPAHNQYSDTANLFHEWKNSGVLRRDQEPSYYLLRQVFSHEGKEWSRLGLTACIGLANYDSGQVLPHEYTESPAVQDRVSLITACNANSSPIMGLYRDTDGALAPKFQQAMDGPPVLDVDDGLGLRVTLWQIADPNLLEAISRFFQDRVIFLADGHHRYEAALQFQRNQLNGGGTGPDQAYNFVMMTLIGFDDPGLLVLPYHRLLGGLSPNTYSEVTQELGKLFQSTPIRKGSAVDAGSITQEVANSGSNGHAIGMVGSHGDAISLLTLRQEVDWRDWGPLAVSEAWILEEKVLKPVLGATTLDHLGYIHDHQEAVESVVSGERQLAFLLKPFPINQFERVVSQGQRLPRKSTFFYPKLPTGLVINQLGGTL